MAATLEELERRLTRIEAAVGRLQSAAHGMFGMTVGQFQEFARAHPEQEWTDEAWADFTAFVGVGEGPPDLAKHSRRYLRGELR